VGPATGSRAEGALEHDMNVLTWDAVTWMSIAMVVIAIVIFIFLGFKVMKLMNQDAEKNKTQR
jgi:hypothetical protein